MNPGRDGDQRGVAVVLVLGMVAVLMTLALVCGGVVALVVTHRKAQAAADLAALAGATDLQVGRDACAGVGRIAEANGALVESCAVRGSEVTVTVLVRTSPLLGGRELRARARAGPGEDHA